MDSTTQRTDMDVYWNGAGGEKWVNNLTHLESVIAPVGKHLLSSLPLNKTTSVLDIGCGGGLISEPMSRLGAKVTGIDASGKNIKIAKIHSKKNNLKIDY